MTRTSTQRTLSPQPAHPGVAANASNSAINVHESYTRTHTTDNGEPPVREKLKKTSITAESHTPGSGVVAEMGVPGAATASTTAVTNLDVKSTKDISEEERGRLSRKRSFDDVEVDEQEVKLSEKPIGGEKKDSRARKRSKDSKDDRSDDGYDCEKDRSESLLTKETTSGTVEDALGDPGESLAKSEPYGASGRDGQRAAETSKNIHHQKRRASWPELVDAGSDRKVVSKEKHITPPLQEDNKQEDDLKETIGSPKNKRTRDEFTKDEDIAHVDEGITDSKDEPFDAGKVKNGDEPKSKRHRDSSSPQPEEESVEKKPPVATATTKLTGGFSNKSATSPFAAVGENTKDAEGHQPSTTGFASSGFAALSNASPFEKLSGTSKPSSAGTFGNSVKPTVKEPYAILKGNDSSNTAKPSNIAGSRGKLGFTSNTGSSSGFGMLGKQPMKGFGSLSGDALKTFATGSGNSISGISDKANKPFGAAADEEEDQKSEPEDDKIKNPQSEENHADKRFFAQNVETGEEEEEVVFSCRAKLYNYVKINETKKEWKERGLGVLKLNRGKVNDEEEKDTSRKARFIMRADGSHRVVLNSPVKKELKFGSPDGKAPSGGYLYFWGSIDGKPQLELLQLKMKQEFAIQLYEHVTDLQGAM